jgi:hypothetical protein
MPITSAPTEASARTNSRWFLGKDGSTNTTRTPHMLAGRQIRGAAPVTSRPVGGAVPDTRVRFMVAAAFVAPYLLEATARFVADAAALPDVRLGLITCDPLETVPPMLRDRLSGHWRVENALDPRQIAEGVSGLGRQMGRVERLVGALEQLQVPLAQVREAMGIEGMDERTAHNVRDKSLMKKVLREAGVPCASHALVTGAAEATAFARRSASPWSPSPRPEPARKATYRLDDAESLEGWLHAVRPESRGTGPPRGVPRRRGAHVRQRHDRRRDRVVVDRRLPAARRWRSFATPGSSGR